MRSRAFTILMLMAGAGQADVAWARDPAPRFVPRGESADAPRGFVDMCARDAALCRLGAAPDSRTDIAAPVAAQDGMATAALARTAGRTVPVQAMAAAPPRPPGMAPQTDGGILALIKLVNSQVNHQYGQKTDYQTRGTGEYWEAVSTNPMHAGDCEDFAIEKRLRLAGMGVAPERMFYGIAFVRGFGLHTVLVVRLGDGDYVLDSLEPWVRPWGDARYTWLRFQVPGEPTAWVRADDGPKRQAPVLIAGL